MEPLLMRMESAQLLKMSQVDRQPCLEASTLDQFSPEIDTHLISTESLEFVLSLVRVTKLFLETVPQFDQSFWGCEVVMDLIVFKFRNRI